jgi:glycosyltransferase involved in cell wall biosynthesis
MALCKPKSTKLFWMEQNTYYTRTQAQWNLLRCLMHRVTKIICISDDVANLTLEKLGKNTKLCVIPNPVMIVNKQFNLLNKKNEFIFIGRLTPQKNPHLALLSFANFLRIYNGKSHLHIVGGGELERELKTKASDLKIKSNCTFYGSISNKEVYNLLEKTKTLISTSRIEGLAMVRLEALANGNCIVTTESGGTHQYFSNNSNLGVFVSASNPFIFSELMLKSLEKKYWNSKTINMRISKSKKFNSENIVKLILLEYKKIKIEK